jgi:hypothetical protein
VDDDLGITFVNERLRLLCRSQHSLVGLQRLLAGREDRVLGRGRKGQPFAAHNRLPLPRSLQRHVVATGAQRSAKRDHREGVARVAEGAEQQSHGGSVCRQLGD